MALNIIPYMPSLHPLPSYPEKALCGGDGTSGENFGPKSWDKSFWGPSQKKSSKEKTQAESDQGSETCSAVQKLDIL